MHSGPGFSPIWSLARCDLGIWRGIALTVVVSQIPTMLGIDGGGERLIPAIRNIAKEVSDVDSTTMALGGACLIGLLAVKRFTPRIPAALVVVVGAIALNRFAQLSVEAVRALPSGLPSFVIPQPGSASLDKLALAAAAISVIAFADTSILSRSYARRLNEDVDSNQELRALGGVNLATGLFQGFPISSSSSRTPWQNNQAQKRSSPALSERLVWVWFCSISEGFFDPSQLPLFPRFSSAPRSGWSMSPSFAGYGSSTVQTSCWRWLHFWESRIQVYSGE